MGGGHLQQMPKKCRAGDEMLVFPSCACVLELHAQTALVLRLRAVTQAHYAALRHEGLH